MNRNENLKIKTNRKDSEIYVEDSVLFYIFPFNQKIYNSLDIHGKINLKDSLINSGR